MNDYGVTVYRTKVWYTLYTVYIYGLRSVQYIVGENGSVDCTVVCRFWPPHAGPNSVRTCWVPPPHTNTRKHHHTQTAPRRTRAKAIHRRTVKVEARARMCVCVRLVFGPHSGQVSAWPSAHVPSACAQRICAQCMCPLDRQARSTAGRHVQSAGRFSRLYLQVGGRGQGSKLGSKLTKLTKLFLHLPLAFVLSSSSVRHCLGRHTQHVRLVDLYAPLQGKVCEDSRLKRVACERA